MTLYDLIKAIIQRVNVSVRTTAQELSESEKQRARENIGITGTGKDGKDGYTPVKGVDYFDGKNGVDGKDGYTPVKGKDYFDGKDGKTPVYGEDYFTEEDKAEMVSSVIDALPVYDGEVVSL